MYQYHWFLLLLFCVFTSFSGQSQDHRIFIDYGACTKGLIVDGDTVIPAQYDVLLKARHSLTRRNEGKLPNYWIVVSGEEQGLINSNYELIIPLGLYSVRLINDSTALTASDSIGYQLHHGFNKNIKTPIYSNILADFYPDSVFICAKGDSTHFYDLNLKLIRSVPYKNVAPHSHLMNCSEEDTRYLYKIDSAGYSGFSSIHFDALFLEKGKVITPIRAVNQQCYSNDDIFFQLRDSTGWSGLCNLSGSIRLPCDHNAIDLYRLQKFPGDPNTLAFAYLRKQKSFKVHELHSGIASKSYDNIHYFEGYHIAVDSNKSYILNESLEPIDSLTDTAYFLSSRRQKYLRGLGAPYPDSLILYDHQLRRTHNNIFVGSDYRPKPNQADLQIRNFQTGKTTEKQFNYIETYSDNDGKVFYHGIQAKSSKNSYLRKRYSRKGKCTVYDTKLKAVSTYSGRLMRNLQDSSIDALIFENKSRKQGVLSISGDTIVPFDFDLIEYTEIRRYSEVTIVSAHKSARSGSTTNVPKRINDSLFIVTRNKKQGIFNIRGETILPVRYKRISLYNGTIQALTDDTLFYYSCCDTLTVNYAIPQFSQDGPVSKKMKRPNTRKRTKKKKQQKIKYKYFEENNIYYVHSSYNDSVQKLRDSYNQNDAFIARDRRILNRESEIVYRTKQKRISIYTSGSTTFFFDGNECILLDSSGVLAVEKFPKNREANILNDYILVNSSWNHKKRFSGLYDIKALRWNFPIEENIETIIKDYKIVVRGNETNGYQVYDLDGSLKLPFKLKHEYNFDLLGDYYYVEIYDTTEYSRRKTVILDSNFQYFIGPTYDELSAFEYGIIEMEDTNQNITLFKGLKKISLPKVQTSYYDNNVFVFKQPDSIASLDSDLNFEMPFTHLPDLFKTHNLKSLYFLEKDPNFQKLARVTGENIPDSTKMLLENLTIWPYLQKYNTYWNHYHSYAEFNPSAPIAFDTANVPVQYGRRSIGKGSYQVTFKYREYTPFNNLVQSLAYYDSTYYFPQTRHYKKRFGKKTYPVTRSTEFNAVRIDTNYFFLTDTALIELPDFKFTETHQREEFRALLLKKLNEAQALGLRCVNIEAEIDHLAKNFDIEKSGVRFRGTRRLHSIQIPYYELLGVWKNPYTIKKDVIRSESP